MAPLVGWPADTDESKRIYQNQVRRMRRGWLIVAAIVGVIPVGVAVGIVAEWLVK